MLSIICRINIPANERWKDAIRSPKQIVMKVASCCYIENKLHHYNFRTYFAAWPCRLSTPNLKPNPRIRWNGDVSDEFHILLLIISETLKWYSAKKHHNHITGHIDVRDEKHRHHIKRQASTCNGKPSRILLLQMRWKSAYRKQTMSREYYVAPWHHTSQKIHKDYEH